MSQTRENTFNFDSTALAGLRGISALHIVLFHSLTYCIYNFDVYAQVCQHLQCTGLLRSLYDESKCSWDFFDIFSQCKLVQTHFGQKRLEKHQRKKITYILF